MQYPIIQDHQSKIHLTKGSKLHINEYLLILQPHEDLYNKIMDIKQSFANKYECSIAMYTKPQIILASFVQWEMQETKLINRLKNIIENLTPFSVKIDGFGSFPSHTIYKYTNEKQYSKYGKVV